MKNLNLNAIRKLLKTQFKKRPILACIRYEPERVMFTNSYMLVQLNVRSSITEPINFNLETLRIMNDTYPNVDSIIENSFYDRLPIKDISVEVDLTQKIQYYKINDLYFEKCLVDDTFKTVGLDITTADRDYLFTNKSCLVYYDNEEIFLLVLRINKND